MVLGGVGELRDGEVMRIEQCLFGLVLLNPEALALWNVRELLELGGIMGKVAF